MVLAKVTMRGARHTDMLAITMAGNLDQIETLMGILGIRMAARMHTYSHVSWE